MTNTENGRQYVGQTVNPRKRWAEHRRAENPNYPLHRAILKYGVERFRFEVLCECESQADMDERELYYGTELNTLAPNGYNLKLGNSRGIVADETHQRMSDARSLHYKNPEARKKASEASLRRYQSETEREKAKATQRKRFEGMSQEERARRSEHLRSPDAIKKREETKRQQRQQRPPVVPTMQTARKPGKPGKQYEFIDPNGEYIVVTNLKQFCKDNGLNYDSMFRLTAGRTLSNHGWTLTHPVRGRKKNPGNTKTFRFLSPDGYVTEVENLKQFCRENNLSYGVMRLVLAGFVSNHKGWRKP